MFKKIKEHWKEARGINLQNEYLDLTTRLNNFSDDMIQRSLYYAAKSYVSFENHQKVDPSYRDDVITDKKKVKYAKSIMLAARSQYDRDVCVGHGLALFSMWLESQTLPGQQARYVEMQASDLLQSGLKIYEREHLDSVGG